MQLSLQNPDVLLDNYPLRKFLNYNDGLLLTFYLVFILFPMTLPYLEFTLPRSVPRIPLSVCLYQYALLLVFLITVIFTKVRYVFVVLIISPMTSNTEDLFMCIFSIQMSSLENDSFCSFKKNQIEYWRDSTVGIMMVLHMTGLGSISNVPYCLQAPPEIIPLPEPGMTLEHHQDPGISQI